MCSHALWKKTVYKFFLADQAIIWRALKSGEELGIGSNIRIGKKNMSYSALDIRNSVLQKFSCENSISNKPMIAISRSAYENNFQLLTEDIVLFSSMDYGIYPGNKKAVTKKSNFEPWINTLNYQLETWMDTLHRPKKSRETRDISWSNLLEVALAMIVSAKIKSRPMKRIHKKARSVLLKSFSLNGLLSRHLDDQKSVRLPEDLAEHPNYWNVMFEVPHILWMYGKNLSSTAKRSPTGRSMPSTVSVEPTFTPGSNGSSRHFFRHKIHSAQYNEKEEAVFKYPDEWLYSRPRFLTYKVDLSSNATKRFCEQANFKDLGTVISTAARNVLQQEHQSSLGSTPFSRRNRGYIINIPEVSSQEQATDFEPCYIVNELDLRLQIDPNVRSNLDMYYANLPVEPWEGIVPLPHESIIDTIRPLLLLGKKNQRSPSISTANGIRPPGIFLNSRGYRPLESITEDTDSLSAPLRKRLMHFFQMDHELAMTCYRSFPEAKDLSMFLDRHAAYDKYFREDLRLVSNTWATELHLSFYQVQSYDQHVHSGICQPRTIEFPRFKKSDKLQSISRISLSLRIDGDCFDRSWICHFIEDDLQWLKEQDRLQPLTTKINIDGEAKSVDWQDRRILELLILGKMLDTILQSTKDVLKEIKHDILRITIKHGEMYRISQQEVVAEYDTSMFLAEFQIFDKASTEVILSIHSVWHKFQRITDILDADLQENITTIALWIDREEKRHDKPRWSGSKETKYASQLSAMNTHKFDELKRCHNNIKAFNASLEKRMEAARNKWEIQSSNDIRLFTYVTVVFLPIGFATSIFSMSGAPSAHALKHMLVIAATALGVTIISLLNAKALDSKLVRPVYRVCRYGYYSCSSILRSFIFVLYRIVVLPSISVIHHFMILPCAYFIARYIYYPLFFFFDGESVYHQYSRHTREASTKGKEALTIMIDDGEVRRRDKSRDQTHKLIHKFDNPLSQACQNFGDTNLTWRESDG
jgi:hypothetical protein